MSLLLTFSNQSTGVASLQQPLSQFGAGFTYARADATTCATRIDADGKLQLVAANTTPYDYTWGDQAYLSEESRQNKCTNHNMTPTDITGLSVTGDCTVAAVSDTAAVTAADLEEAVTGNVIEAVGGAGGGTVIISGAIGTATICAASLYARDVTSTGASFGITPTPTAKAISGSTYVRYLAERLTATDTGDTMVITVPAGVTIRFILNQLELGQNCTSVIKVDGTARTRAKTSFVRTDLATQAWFNRNNGGMCFEITPQEDASQAGNQAIVVAGSTGSFPTEAYYIQSNATSSKINTFSKGNNVTSSAASPNTGLWKRNKISVGMSWSNTNRMIGMIGPASYRTITHAITTGAITTLTLGSYANISGNFNGWIHSATFFNTFTTAPQLAKYMLGSKVGFTERGVLLAGQSNAENLGNGVTSTFLNAGEKAFREMAHTILGGSSRKWLVNGATGSTAIVAWQEGASAYITFKNIVDAYTAAGGTIDAIWWDQGESDVGLSTSTLKTSWLEIFDRLRSYVQSKQGGTAPDIFIAPLGKYHFPASYNNSTNDGAINMRRAQRELASENSYVHLMMEKFHQPLVDAVVHLTDAGYASHAINGCRFIYKTLGETVDGGINGPTITNAVRTGDSIAITTAQDSGTDFSTMSLTIDGWRFFQNGSSSTPIDVDSVTYNSPTSLTVTLASDPGSGNHTLMYGNDLLWGDVQADLIRDNATFPLALRQFTATVT